MDAKKYLTQVSVVGNRALQLAAERGYLNLVEFFTKNGADMNADHRLALRLAVQNKHWDVVEYLKNGGTAKHKI